MCVVSMVLDDWNERNRRYYDGVRDWPIQQPTQPYMPQIEGTVTLIDATIREDFESFKKEVRKELRELKKLLKAAKEYDDKTGQPNCEKEEAIKAILALAKLVDVDLEEVFGQSEGR